MGQYGCAEGGIYLVETADDVWALTVKNEQRLRYVTQTTLSVDDASIIVNELRKRFSAIEGPRKDDICYATQNRQDAVKTLALETDIVFVVGSPNSSNSNRLRELAERCGAKAFLVDEPGQLQRGWLDDVKTIGVTAGASAPEELVLRVVNQLREWGGATPDELSGREENIVFSMPKELR